jgi:hypothetical protein
VTIAKQSRHPNAGTLEPYYCVQTNVYQAHCLQSDPNAPWTGTPTKRLTKEFSDLLGLLGVHVLNALDLLAVLENDDGGELGELEMLLGRGELVDVHLVGIGGGSELLGVSGQLRQNWSQT